jgi:tRNA-dihydrouridine synthase 4
MMPPGRSFEHNLPHDQRRSRTGKGRAPDDSWIRVSAPMVRYSRLPMRLVWRQHGHVDLSYTPMILADSFVRSEHCRRSDLPLLFSPSSSSSPNMDSPLVVQFAANDANTFATAAAMVSRHALAVDLNCGCPQAWARSEGLGSALLAEPQRVQELIRAARHAIPPDKHITAKLRLLPPAALVDAEGAATTLTVELARRLERMGASWLTVHGRTPQQGGRGPVNYAAIGVICHSLQIPVIANGGVASAEQADRVQQLTGCAGVMVAQRLLEDPTMFRQDIHSHDEKCTLRWQCLLDYVRYATHLEPGLATPQDAKVFCRHVQWQLHDLLPPPDRKQLRNLHSVAALIDLVRQHSPLEHGN